MGMTGAIDLEEMGVIIVTGIVIEIGMILRTDEAHQQGMLVEEMITGPAATVLDHHQPDTEVVHPRIYRYRDEHLETYQKSR